MKKLLIALCLALFFAPISQAGEALQLELIGFSRNGAYVAFEQTGKIDGKGGSYAETSFMSVKHNRLEAMVRTSVKFRPELLADAKLRNLEIPAMMKKYGIVSGNQGRFIGITPPHKDTTISKFFTLDRMYGLSIATKPTSTDMGGACAGFSELLIVKLEVSGKIRDLQRDTWIPAASPCAYGYQMRSAHLYGRSLAVFVSYSDVGFEGDDSRWMVITGML